MTDWQPIATAPKDGREVLLWMGDRTVTAVWGEPPLLDDAEPRWLLAYDESEYLWHGTPEMWAPIDFPPGFDNSPVDTDAGERQ